MTDPTPERNAELAALIEPKPAVEGMGDYLARFLSGYHAMSSPHGAWYCVCRYDHGDVPEWEPRPYGASLDLMAKVETEIGKRGLSHRYAETLFAWAITANESDWSGWNDEWLMATAPAHVRRDAAISALNGGK